jgi:hypothetical protein
VANRFWVGGTTTWDATAGTKWAATSGGAGGQTVPTAADDVFFDANSGAGTVTTSGTTTDVCRSLTFTGFAGTFTFGSSTTVSVGDASGGNLTIGSGMTISIPGTGVKFAMVSSSGVIQSITSSGKTMPQIEINCGTTTTIQLADNLTLFASAPITHTQGKFDTNNKTINAGQYASSNSNTRTLTMGSSNITLTLQNSPWSSTNTGLTITANTATLIFSAASASIAPGASLNFNGATLSFTGTGTNLLNGTGTLTMGGLSLSGSGANLKLSVTATCTYTTGNFTMNGTPAAHMGIVSVTAGTSTQLTVTGTASMSYVDVTDLIVLGASAPLDNATGIDNGNNRGVKFSTPYINQFAQGTSAATNSPTATLPINTTSGNTIVVAAVNAGARTISSITDSQSNTYSVIDTGTNPNSEFWYAKNITGGTTPTITATYVGGAAASCVIACYELGGVSASPLDVHTVASGSSTAPASGNTASTTVASEQVIAWTGVSINSALTKGTGYGNLVSRANSTQVLGMENKLVSATGAQSGGFTSGNGAWICGVASFKAGTVSFSGWGLPL